MSDAPYRVGTALLAVAAAVFVVALLAAPVLLGVTGLAFIFDWGWFFQPNPDALRVSAGVVLLWVACLAGGLILTDGGAR